MGGVGVRAASIPFISQLQVRHGERLRSKSWHHVFESGDVLAHDLLGAQAALSHSVLLEGPHKRRKNPPDPDFCQEVVSGNVFGERPRDALQIAEREMEAFRCYLEIKLD